MWLHRGRAPPLTASKTITIDASAAKVWRAAKDFNVETLASCRRQDEIVEGKNNTVGAVRLLTLKGAGHQGKAAPLRPGPLVQVRHHRRRSAGQRLYVDLRGQIPGKDKSSSPGPALQTQERRRQSCRQRKRQDGVDTIGALSGRLDNLKKIVEAK